MDIWYPARRLTAMPAFTFTVLAVFALGIGGNTAVFSLLNSIVLHPAGIKSPDRLMVPRVRYQKLNIPSMSMSDPDFADVLDGRTYFSSSAAMLSTPFTYRDTRTTTYMEGAKVTWQYFDVLGAHTELGRTFYKEEDQPNRNHVVILSSDMWTTRFGADRRVIGQRIYLNDLPYEVVGVMPSDFQLPRQAKLWVPMGRTYASFRTGDRYNEDLTVFSRLRDEVTSSQADAWLRDLSQRLLRQGDQSEAQREAWSMFAIPFLEYNNGGLRKQLTIMAAALMFVLLIACLNIAGLMVARTSGQSAEYAVRLALGASHTELLKLWMSESVILCSVGGFFGLLLGNWAARVFLAEGPTTFTQGFSVTLDPWILCFTLGITALACLVFGTVPIFQVIRSKNLRTHFIAGTRVSGLQGFRQVLVVSQLALALALLVGTGLLTRSISNLRDVDPGFDSHGMMTAQLTLSSVRYNTPAKLSAFYQRALDRLRAMPGINAVAVATALPYAKGPATGSFTIVGHPSLPGQPWPYGSYNFASNDFLRVMRIRLLRGRFFDQHDQQGSELICVVDDLLAKRYWPHRDPVGEQIERDGYRLRIVGIVSHVRPQLENGNGDGGYYQPLLQSPLSSVVFVMRISQAAGISPGQIRQVFRELDSTQPVYDVDSMDSRAEQSLNNRRIIAALLGVFSSFALLLTAVGVYGVIRYSVSQRTLEIGIRMALGAKRIDILRLIVGQGLRLAIAGVLVGLGVAALLGNFFRHQLYAVGPMDPETYMTMTGVVLLTALSASVLPARRASTVEPNVALRR